MQVGNWTKKVTVCLFLALIVTVSTVFGADSVLNSVPADSVFCVKITNLDSALGQIDQFASGLAPMVPSMMIRMKIAQLLGDPQLQGLNTAGDIAIFGIGQIKPDSNAPNMFIGVLLPVKDYDSFVNLSPAVGQPDAGGISEITNQPLAAVKAGGYALFGNKAQSAKLTEIAKNTSSIISKLDSDQVKLSGEMPIWAYADIEKIQAVFGDKINQGFAKAQEEIKKQSPNVPQTFNISEIMQIYFDLINNFLEQGKYASVSLKPSADVLRIHKVLAAKPETEMAGFFTADATAGKTNKLAGLMEDGAAINCAMKVQDKWMKKLTPLSMSFCKNIMAEEEAAKWEKIMTDRVGAMGNTIMLSCKADAAAKPAFAVKYAVEIKDKAKYQKMQGESIKLMQESSFGDMDKKMGIETKFDYKKAVSTYNGVEINYAKFGFNVTDTNAPQAMMIKQICGEGIEHLTAMTDNYFVMAMGSDKDAAIKKLIDSVKSGDIKAPSGQVAGALALLDNSADADIVGTFNIIKMMQMVMGFVPMPMPIPFDQIPTSSNIAFAAKASDGKMVADVAVPKQHIQEYITGMQMLMMQKMQQQQQQQPKTEQ